jgi:hypothetical protein
MSKYSRKRFCCKNVPRNIQYRTSIDGYVIPSKMSPSPDLRGRVGAVGFELCEMWLINDMAELSTASLSASICLPAFSSCLMKSWASTIEGECGTLAEWVIGDWVDLSYFFRLLRVTSSDSAERCRLAEFARCEVGGVRQHWMFPSTQLPQGSLRSHRTFLARHLSH